MLFDGLRIEHQCRPRAVAAADASTTIVYRSMFLSFLLRRPIQCFSVPTFLKRRNHSKSQAPVLSLLVNALYKLCYRLRNEFGRFHRGVVPDSIEQH